MTPKKAKISSAILSLLLPLGFMVITPVALAQSANNTPPVRINTVGNLDAVAGRAGYDITTGTAVGPVEIIGNVIGYALALLGVIFTLLTLYAGFLWMTAQGASDQIDKAKKMLTNAVIGLAIITASYALTRFVFDVVLKSAQVTSASGT
ncbi:MAG: hypothetical protein WCT10_04410 [Patescibacteria group bacterium]|jgi:hypothetical protein